MFFGKSCYGLIKLLPLLRAHLWRLRVSMSRVKQSFATVSSLDTYTNVYAEDPMKKLSMRLQPFLNRPTDLILTESRCGNFSPFYCVWWWRHNNNDNTIHKCQTEEGFSVLTGSLVILATSDSWIHKLDSWCSTSSYIGSAGHWFWLPAQSPLLEGRNSQKHLFSASTQVDVVGKDVQTFWKPIFNYRFTYRLLKTTT